VKNGRFCQLFEIEISFGQIGIMAIDAVPPHELLPGRPGHGGSFG
jgi:hypothetical protein